MKAVILTAPGREHGYVASALAAALSENLCAVVLEEATPSFRNAARRYSPPRLAERVITKVVRKALRHSVRQARALDAVLGDCALRLPPHVATLHTSSVNSSDTLAAVRAWQPSHLFVYGTGLVGKTMRESAPLTLNLHTGLSPDYRGADTEFWPLYHGRPEMVGATVHVCVKEVDGGPIFVKAPAGVQGDDDVFVAFAKAVRVGATLYSDVARQLKAGERLIPEPQNHRVGRAYRFIDRTFLHDLKMEWRMRQA